MVLIFIPGKPILGWTKLNSGRDAVDFSDRYFLIKRAQDVNHWDLEPIRIACPKPDTPTVSGVRVIRYLLGRTSPL